MRIFTTPSDAYLGALEEVYFNPEFKCSPRGQPIREITDYQFCILMPDSLPIVTKNQERNDIITKYTKKEMDLYNSCSNKVEDFAKASKFWNNIANPDGTVNSAYGYLIWKNKSCGKDIKITPWEWATNSLKVDKDTRQAILRFSLPSHQYASNKDQVCTMHANFLIRENKLNLSVVMRSNDLVLGLVYDLPFFCSLIDRMLDELKDTYPTLEKGTYTHIVHSLHVYERNEDKILDMLGYSEE